MPNPKPHTFSFLLCLADDHNDISSLLSLSRLVISPFRTFLARQLFVKNAAVAFIAMPEMQTSYAGI
jgi:hypothetical protein